jgi:glycosyltransferase involved in cell wall biosynthesis
MPLVSVIIPTYNRSQLLKRAIQSVLKQTYQDYELIIIDDCSKDNTTEIINQFKDNRIKYNRRTINSGGSLIPRQDGIKLSTGIYIAVLDDDDFWHDKNKLEFQIKYLEDNPSCVMTGTDAVAVNGEIKIIANHHYPKSYSEIKEKLLLQNWFFHSSVVYRKEILIKVGGYPPLDGGYYSNFINEYELWLKMGMVGEIVNLPIDGVGYTYSNRYLSMKNHIDFMLRHFKTINVYKKYYPHFIRAIIFNLLLTLFELPLLINIKRIIRGY